MFRNHKLSEWLLKKDKTCFNATSKVNTDGDADKAKPVDVNAKFNAELVDTEYLSSHNLTTHKAAQGILGNVIVSSDDIIKRAYDDLFPGMGFSYKCSLKYSARFKGFNANVRYTKNSLHFNLSKNWQGVSEDIVKGLLQHLMTKIFRVKKKTMYIELYHLFLKKAHLGVVTSKIDPVLEESFDKLNNIYFNGLLDKPNLVWGRKSIRRFGSYDYGTDTITISRTLESYPDLLDYVMYHEMLHKKHKFNHKLSKTMHHTKAFREDEKKYPNAKELDQKLSKLANSRR